MGTRHTFLLDEDIESQLRKMQAELINSSNASISFSQVINVILREGLRKKATCHKN
jgi:hypothetical protein